MRKAALLALLAAAPLSAQTPSTIYPFHPDASTVEALWDSVMACAGPKRDTARTLAEVKWFLRTPTVDEAGDSLLGEWSPPDSIFITLGHSTELWVLEHELLHHALNGPPTGDAHPWLPFAFPCRVMEFQHENGGIMASRAVRRGHSGGADDSARPFAALPEPTRRWRLRLKVYHVPR